MNLIFRYMLLFILGIFLYGCNDKTIQIPKSQNEEIVTAAEILLEGLPEDPLSRLTGIHDRLLEHVSYRQGKPQPEDTTVYGAIVNGIALCNGYSKAFQYLCEQSGITCKFIEGQSVRGIPHSWNMVLLDGKWLYVDTTWDESTYERCYHDYFLISLSEMSKEHFPDSNTAVLPDTPALGYYERFGYSANSDSNKLLEEMANAFTNQLKDFPPKHKGRSFLEIKLTGKKYEEGRILFQNNLFTLLHMIDEKAVEQNIPFAIETSGALEYNFNDTTCVLTIFPLLK